jgi:glutamate synthase (NADPH/NADH) small chain
MEYLKKENRRQAGRDGSDFIDARGKAVVVLGGGDTGADCVATAHRQGAKQVVQISINLKSPLGRPEDNPWPEWPQIYRKTYAVEEGGVEEFSADATGFIDTDGDGNVDILTADRVEWTYEKRNFKMARTGRRIVEANMPIPAELVLIAIGFAGPECQPFGNNGIEITPRGTIKTDRNMMTNLPGVFAAGDANTGQSIVVTAIGEGRDVARNIDLFLMGSTRLPASIRTPNPPIGKV